MLWDAITFRAMAASPVFLWRRGRPTDFDEVSVGYARSLKESQSGTPAAGSNISRMLNRLHLVLLIITFVATATVIGQKTDPNMGTWKLNPARSTYTPGPAPRSELGTFTLMGDNVKLVVDRIDAEGKPVHIEWLGKFDGKFYPSQGDVTSDDRSYRKINDYIYEFIGRKDGKVVRSGVSVYSHDGKVRTNTIVGANALGQTIYNIQVYDRQ